MHGNPPRAGRTSPEQAATEEVRHIIQAMALVLRDLTLTATPAPISRTANTVNSMVPAPPVSGSWVMLFTFSTVASAPLPFETSPHLSLPVALSASIA